MGVITNVKIDYEDLTMILLASLPLSYENFVSSLSVGNDSIRLEEIKSSLYSRELWLKMSRNSDEAFAFRLSMIDSAKGKKKKKGKGRKKSNVDQMDICNHYKEPSHWKKDCPKKAKKDFVVAVVQNDSSSENDLVLAVGEYLQQHYEQWILDSCCS